MNTLSNIIPNPLNINDTLNSDYSTSRFATSDFSGESNTEVIKKYKDNITPNKMNKGFYLGGIGELGLIMENVDYINNIIKQYDGTQISLNGKYVSSTFYNTQNVSNKQYILGNNIKNVWYYDVAYGKISYGPLNDPYQSLPIYKYDIMDFDSTSDDYLEVDNDDLYLGKEENCEGLTKFDILSYIYYCQNDNLDNLENSLSYSFYVKPNTTNIEYNYKEITDCIESNHLERLSIPDDYYSVRVDYYQLQYKLDILELEIPQIYVLLNINGEEIYIPVKILNNSYRSIENGPEDDFYYYMYFEYNDQNYCIYSNNSNALYNNYSINTNINGRESTLFFASIKDNLIENISCEKIIDQENITIVKVYVYTATIIKTQNDKDYISFNKDNIIKYPIYSKEYNSKQVYSFPLLPSAKIDNYYDCEFYIFVPEFSKYNSDNTRIKIYNTNLVYNNIKVSIKFGDGEINEMLDPYIKLNDVVIYKFHKSWLYDYMFINNQEIIISLIDKTANTNASKILVSKKLFFNLFKINILQGKYQDINFRIKYNNYFPLKYPLESKKKFLELNYVPYEKIENFSYETLINTEIDKNNSNQNSNSFEYQINFLDLSNNYAYLNNNIYHNLNETNTISEWFIKDNGNGLMIAEESKEENTYAYLYHYSNSYFSYSNSYFTFYLGNNLNDNYDIKSINAYCKYGINYDENGILDLSTDIIKLNKENNPSTSYLNKYCMDILGVKQLIYLPYKFDIGKTWNNTTRVCFEHDDNKFSIFEDYLYIYNSTSNKVNLYFSDESLTLCENTRMITLNPNEWKLYKPSKHDDYNIIIKNCFLDEYKLELYKIYKDNTDYKENDFKENGYIDDNDKVWYITRDINYIKTFIKNIGEEADESIINARIFIDYIYNHSHNEENSEILNIPIYNYNIPLFGNVVIIKNL